MLRAGKAEDFEEFSEEEVENELSSGSDCSDDNGEEQSESMTGSAPLAGLGTTLPGRGTGTTATTGNTPPVVPIQRSTLSIWVYN